MTQWTKSPTTVGDDAHGCRKATPWVQSLTEECDEQGHKHLHSWIEEENEEVIVNEAYEPIPNTKSETS